jgi:hypothetical protein
MQQDDKARLGESDGERLQPVVDRAAEAVGHRHCRMRPPPIGPEPPTVKGNAALRRNENIELAGHGAPLVS